MKNRQKNFENYREDLKLGKSRQIMRGAMGLEGFKRAASNFVGEMSYAYKQSKKYLDTSDKVILGLATGAISLFTLGILTKPAYTYLVGKLKNNSETFDTHQAAVAEKINQKVLNQKDKNLIVLEDNDSKITITDPDYTDQELQKLLQNYPNITHLTLLGCTKITNEALRDLPTSLTSLVLTGCDRISNSGINYLEKLANLEALELAGCDNLKDRSLDVIAKLPKLKHLDLGGCFNLTNEGLEKLTNLELESLDISDCKKIKSLNLLEKTPLSNTLTTLNVKRTGISETEWIIWLPQLQNLSLEGSFEKVDLSLSKLNTLEISNLKVKNPKNLMTIPELKVFLPESLKQLRIYDSDDVIEGITKKLDDLETLHISGFVELTPTFLEKIDVKSLKELSLNGISFDENIQSFISKCTNLEKLDLSDTEIKTSLNFENLNNLSSVNLEGTTLKEGNVKINGEKISILNFGKKPTIEEDFIEEKINIPKETPPIEEPKEEAILPKNLQGLDPGNTTELKLPPNTSDDDLKALVDFNFKWLTTLDLSGCNQITEKGLEHLKQLERLHTLNLTGSQLNEDTWSAVGQIRQLTILTLDQSNFPTGILYTLGPLRNLENLSLKNVFLPEEDRQKLIVSMTKLQFLNGEKISSEDHLEAEKKLKIEQKKEINLEELEENKIDPSKYRLENGILTLSGEVNNEDLKKLTSIPNFEAIQSVILQNNQNVTDVGLNVLGNLKGLKNINLKGCSNLTGTFFMRLGALKNLESLDLSDCPSFIDVGIQFLQKKNLPIKALNLSGTAITESSLNYLKKFEQLESLDLRNTKIADVNLEELN